MTRLRPKLTLHDLTGPGHRLVNRCSDRRGHWLPQDQLVVDAIASGVLPAVGDMPYLTSAATMTPRALRILGRAGVEVPPRIETYVSRDDYHARLLEFTAPGRVFVQHVHAPGEIPAERYWIPPALVSWLNNKANLAELTPPAAVADRRVVPYATLIDDPPTLPCVVKAATDDSTGGGRDVVVCRGPEELAVAVQRFAVVDRVVIEEFLEIEASYCVNFAVHAGGRVDDLGAAEQVCTPDALYDGNWIDANQPPEAVVTAARAAVEAGARRGYFGFVGIDVAVTARGAFVIDLNFRFNGSTPALVLRDAIRADRGDVTMRLRRWPVEAEDWEGAILRAVDAGRLIPINVYDPEAGPYRDRLPFVVGLVLGSDRDDVTRYLSEAQR